MRQVKLILMLMITISLGLVSCEKEVESAAEEQVAQMRADFTGRVKRIRIKKKRVGSGYRVVTKVQGDNSNQVASIELQFEEPFEGPSPQENPIKMKQTSFDKETGKATFEAELEFDDELPDGATYLVVTTMRNADGKTLGTPSEHELVYTKRKAKAKKAKIADRDAMDGMHDLSVNIVNFEGGRVIATLEIDGEKYEMPLELVKKGGNQYRSGFRPKNKGYKAKSGTLTINLYESGNSLVAPDPITITTTVAIHPSVEFPMESLQIGTGEKQTGSPVIYNGTAYFRTSGIETMSMHMMPITEDGKPKGRPTKVQFVHRKGKHFLSFQVAGKNPSSGWHRIHMEAKNKNGEIARFKTEMYVEEISFE